jgi:hypothetical protein
MPIKRSRRQLLTTLTLGGAAGFVCPGDSWPAAPHAKLPGDRPLVAWFSGLSRESAAPLVGAFREGLQELGYSEAMDLEIVYRFSDGREEELSLSKSRPYLMVSNRKIAEGLADG